MKKILLITLAMLIPAGNSYAEKNDIDQNIMKADTNQDGKVSFEEYKAAHEARMLARFKRKDINKDGFIDLEEKIVAKKKKQAKKAVAKKAERQKIRNKYQEDRERRKKHFHKY